MIETMSKLRINFLIWQKISTKNPKGEVIDNCDIFNIPWNEKQNTNWQSVGNLHQSNS